MKKAERHYLVQCNYCGGFAQGRFAFIMFIQMFMLIFWFKRACCSLFQCVFTFFCVGGLLEYSDKWRKKRYLMNIALEVVGCD